jgi:fructosamine-3-kinase
MVDFTTAGTEVFVTDHEGTVNHAHGRRWFTTGAVTSHGDPVLRFEPANALGQTEIDWAARQVVAAS